MSYLTVPSASSHNRLAASDETPPISPYYRDFDFGNLLNKWSNQEVLRSHENSPTRLDWRGDTNPNPSPWNQSGMQQMYDKDVYTSYENSSSALLPSGSASNTDFKHFAKKKLIQSCGAATRNWRQRNDDFTDVSSHSSIDSAAEMSHTAVAKNPMNYWTPTGSRSSNPNSKPAEPTNVNPRGRPSKERTPASKLSHHSGQKQSSEKPFSTSRARITLSANAKTSKSVSPKRRETSNSDDDSSPEEEEVANDGKMRYIYKMTSVHLNSSPKEPIRNAKPSHTSSNGRERNLEKTRTGVKKTFVQNISSSSQSGAISKAKQFHNKISPINDSTVLNVRCSNFGDHPTSTAKEPSKFSGSGEILLNGKSCGVSGSWNNGIQSISIRKGSNTDVKIAEEGVISPPKLFDDESEKRAKLVKQLLIIQGKTPFTNQKWFQIETLKLALENAFYYPDYYRNEVEKHATDLCKDNH